MSILLLHFPDLLDQNTRALAGRFVVNACCSSQADFGLMTNPIEGWPGGSVFDCPETHRKGATLRPCKFSTNLSAVCCTYPQDHRQEGAQSPKTYPVQLGLAYILLARDPGR